MPQVWTVVSYMLAMKKIADRLGFAIPASKKIWFKIIDIYLCKMLCKAMSYNVNFDLKL